MSKVTRDEVTRILGRLDDVKLATVMTLEPTRDELLQAKLWLTQTDLRDTGAPEPLSEKVMRIYDLLRPDTALELDE